MYTVFYTFRFELRFSSNYVFYISQPTSLVTVNIPCNRFATQVSVDIKCDVISEKVPYCGTNIIGIMRGV